MISLIQSARLNGHDPYAYRREVLERLPSQPNCRIGELLPHLWAPDSATRATDQAAGQGDLPGR